MSSQRSLNLRNLLAFLLIEQMDRLAGDDSQHRAAAAPDRQPLADENLWIPAANGRDVDKAVVVDVLHDQANLVAMPGQHDPQRGPGVAGNDDIPMDIGPHFVGERRRIVANYLLYGTLITRRTRGR